MCKEIDNLFFLRPENAILVKALFNAVDRACVEINGLKEKLHSGNGLDFGCGDGLITFLLMNGALNCNFDLFSDGSTGDNEFDPFDVIDNRYFPEVQTSPVCSVKFGIDQKKSARDKARKLNLYDNLSAELDFKRHSNLDFYLMLSCIFHIDDAKKLLRDFYDVMKSGSFLIVNTIEPQILSFYKDIEVLIGENAGRKIERGMIGLWPSLLTGSDWVETVEEIGFSVQCNLPVVDAEFMKFWAIGTRVQFMSSLYAYKTLKQLSATAALKYKHKVMNDYKDFYSMDALRNIDSAGRGSTLFVLKKI